ncbi:hypothetical protein SUGI_0036430 [Cryptomeria japonica]|nr:hypothetical protein SUGI_0036430 [Cryptomeria japonica]
MCPYADEIIYSEQNLEKGTLRKGFDPALLDLIVSLYRRKQKESRFARQKLHDYRVTEAPVLQVISRLQSSGIG